MQWHSFSKQQIMGLVVVLAFCWSGCASFPRKINRLEIGMNQKQVERVLGRDYVSKAARVEPGGSQSRLLQFTNPETNRPFWVFLRDGRVVQWGTPETLRHLTELAPEFE